MICPIIYIAIFKEGMFGTFKRLWFFLATLCNIGLMGEKISYIEQFEYRKIRHSIESYIGLLYFHNLYFTKIESS